MTIYELIVFGLAAAGLVAGWPRLRRLWLGEGYEQWERVVRRLWPYSELALQGWLRATPSMYFGAWFLAAAYPAAVLLPTADGSTRLVLALGVLTGFAGAMVMVVFTATIVLFNLPKRLVFPALRGQEGLLTGRLRKRRRVTFTDAE